MKVLIVIVFFSFLTPGFSQFDTMALKQQVNNIRTEKRHTDFWDFIYERDQNMFQSNKLEQMNMENLILVSYYFNKFGYPDIDILGDKAKIINMVWLHNKYSEVQKMTYPFILHGYLEKQISEYNLRDYFLRILYQSYFDDHGHMQKPLSQIYKELEPNLSSQIDVQSFVKYYMEKEKYFNQDKEILGTWQSSDVMYNGALNGSPYSHAIQGNKVTIYKMPDGKYFFEQLVDGQSIEPKELELIEGATRSFRFLTIQSLKYYQVTDEDDLLFMDENGHTISTFHLILEEKN